MVIEKKKLSELNRAAYNPRVELKAGDDVYEKLKRSIEEFGYVEPIVWNKTTGNVVGGHQRLTVLEDLGHEEVDVVVVELDEKQEKVLNLALNKVKGEWEYGSLATLIKEMQDEGFDYTLTGFEDTEVADLLAEAKEDFDFEPVEDEEEPEGDEEPETIKVVIGSFVFTLDYEEWEDIISQIRLDCGFEKENVIAELKRRLFNEL